MRLPFVFALSLAVPAWAEEAPKTDTIHLYHKNNKDTLEGFRVVTENPQDPLIKYISQESRATLDHFFRDWRTKKQTHMSERTYWNLNYLGTLFDSKIIVTSAYRSGDGPTSPHLKGWAIDLSVEGQPHKSLWEYLKRLDLVGLGYYPNCDFIHLDSRPKKYYWIDKSFPGKPADYLKNVSQTQTVTRRKPKGKVTFNESELHHLLKEFVQNPSRFETAQLKGLQCPKKPTPPPLTSNPEDGLNSLTGLAAILRAKATDPKFVSWAKEFAITEAKKKAEFDAGHPYLYRLNGGIERFEPSGALIKDNQLYVPTDRGGMIMVYNLPLQIGSNAPVQTHYTPEELDVKNSHVKFEALTEGPNGEIYALETYRKHVWSITPLNEMPVEGEHIALLNQSILNQKSDAEVVYLGLEAMAFDGKRLWVGTRHFVDTNSENSGYEPYAALTDGKQTFWNGKVLTVEGRDYTLSDMVFHEGYLWQTWSSELEGDFVSDVSGLIARSKLDEQGNPGEPEICHLIPIGKPEGLTFYNDSILVVFDNDKSRKGGEEGKFALPFNEDYVTFLPASCEGIRKSEN